MAIWRGVGGSGESTNDSTIPIINELLTDAQAARDAAQLAETNAETAATNAASSASTASTQASNASTSATSAASSASAASTSASNAASSATTASTQASNAATSASAASTSASNAASSATSAASSASTATTQASNAASSAVDSTASASLANDWATKTSGPVAGGEYSAKYNAQQAASSASSASSSASTATTQASNASTSASNAASSASSASTSASNAATSATNAASSATAAAASAADAASTLANALVKTNNLSDLNNAATARTNLGVAIGSNVQAWDADLDAIAALAGTSGLLKKTAANTWTLDTSSYITGNQTITVSGDASGSGSTSIALTLANTGVTAGTYTKLTVDAKGRVTTGASLASADLPTYTGTLTSSQVTTALGYTPYNSSNPSGYISGNQTITLNGDLSGSGTTTISATLANSGVTAGTYTKVTVDAKGRVTSGASLASGDLPTYTGTITASQINTGLGYTAGYINIPQNSKTAAYTLIASDVGKHISITTGGVTCNASVFSAGDVVSIFNNSGSNQTITAGASVTFRLAGTATTGNRTLAQYGIATLLCVVGGATPTFIVSGNVT